MKIHHFLFLFLAVLILPACVADNEAENSSFESSTESQSNSANKATVHRIDTLGLKVMYPKFSRVELVCGTMPSKDDRDVVLVMAAAYTAKCMKEFKHSNIVGMHVSDGVFYNGGTNYGAFVYYNGKWKFVSKKHNKAEMLLAAEQGGAGFSQELLILNGEIQKTNRGDNNQNIFRALCDHNGRLCVIESQRVIKFGDFKKTLKTYGVTKAIYTDMGSGWNHAWYRSETGIVELQSRTKNSDYCTNWITFYK